jgi:ADP-L-glycero-D-manno-heptose 6-epimerase
MSRAKSAASTSNYKDSNVYIVVTGAAGFVGANLVKGLNQRGETDIIAVDNLTHADKFRNLVDCEIADYLDKEEFLARLSAGDFEDDLAAILHQGACSDTMETDGRYMMRNNYRYSVALLDHCQNNDIPLLYASSASVYGAGTTFVERREHEAPLNVYGYSKFLFDQHVRRVLPERTAPIVGFRYFNVYGPREQHKGRMASVAFHFFEEHRASRPVRLFAGSGGYAAGEQRRDFVAVADVVAANLDFLDHPQRSGIYNLGSGRAETFNEVAVTVINACRKRTGEPALPLPELVRAGAIEYIEFPPQLVGKYQSFTQADLTALRGAGYKKPMTSVAVGVADYVEWLMAQEAAPTVT